MREGIAGSTISRKRPFGDLPNQPLVDNVSRMVTTRDIADAVGRAEMATALEVSTRAVSNAVSRGYFPPSWYLVMAHLCRDADVECPPALFRIKLVEQEIRGNAPPDIQAEGTT